MFLFYSSRFQKRRSQGASKLHVMNQRQMLGPSWYIQGWLFGAALGSGIGTGVRGCKLE